tara:strand:+ start:75 stop:734 length:660 start_codon:yes stop_codon:yes gene_type:complete
MKLITVIFILLSTITVGQNRIVQITVLDEFNKVIDAPTAKLTAFKLDSMLILANPGTFVFEVRDSSNFIIMFYHKNYYSKATRFNPASWNTDSDTLHLIQPLISMQTIGHNFKSLNLNDWVTPMDFNPLSDTLKFYDNSILFDFHNKDYLQLDLVDSNTYSVVNPKLDSNTNTMSNQMKFSYFHNSSVDLNFGNFQNRYYITGVGRNEYYKIVLIKEKD